MNNHNYDNVKVKLPLYTLSRQKKFTELLKKKYSKLLTQKTCQLVYEFSIHNLLIRSKVIVQIRLFRNFV